MPVGSIISKHFGSPWHGCGLHWGLLVHYHPLLAVQNARSSIAKDRGPGTYLQSFWLLMVWWHYLRYIVWLPKCQIVHIWSRQYLQAFYFAFAWFRPRLKLILARVTIPRGMHQKSTMPIWCCCFLCVSILLHKCMHLHLAFSAPAHMPRCVTSNHFG